MGKTNKKMLLGALGLCASAAVCAGVLGLNLPDANAAVYQTTITGENFFVRSAAVKVVHSDEDEACVRAKVVMEKVVYYNNFGNESAEVGLLMQTVEELGGETLTLSSAAVSVTPTTVWEEVTYQNDKQQNISYMQATLYAYDLDAATYGEDLEIRAYVEVEGETVYSNVAGPISVAKIAKEGASSSVETKVEETYCTFPLSYYVDGEKYTQAGNDLKCVYGKQITAPTAPTKAGHAFLGWYDESGTIAWDFASSVPSGEVKLYAKWSAGPFTVSLKETNGENVQEALTYSGSPVELPTPKKYGYKFVAWYANSSLTGDQVSFENFECTGNTTLYAKWQKVTYLHTYYGYNGLFYETYEIPTGETITLSELNSSKYVTDKVKTATLSRFGGYNNVTVNFTHWGYEVNNGFTNEFTEVNSNIDTTGKDEVVIVAQYERYPDANLVYNQDGSYTSTGNVAQQFNKEATTGTYSLTLSFAKGVSGEAGIAFNMQMTNADFQYEGNQDYFYVAIIGNGGFINGSHIESGWTAYAAKTNENLTDWFTYYDSLGAGAIVTANLKVVVTAGNADVYISCPVNGEMKEWKAFSYADAKIGTQGTGWGIRGNAGYTFSGMTYTANA